MEPIKKLLHGQNFSEFNAKRKEHDFLKKILSNLLNQKFKDKVCSINLINHTLFIEVVNSAVASQIKLSSLQLIEEINARDQLENNIKNIKISVSIHHPKNPKREVREIPTIANQSLQKLKKDISDSPLKNIINSLFKRKK